MKKSISFSSLSVNENGKFTGGFSTLNSLQMIKINGGKRRSDNNQNCTNTVDCSTTANESCNNTGTC